MGQEGGKSLVLKYGKTYFKELRSKVKKESAAKNGRLGGKLIQEKFGNEYFRSLGSRGGKNFSKKIQANKNLQLVYRDAFITKMKQFTRKYPTLSGIKVRSKLEQEIANFLTINNIHFEYEGKAFATDFGEYEPDFIIDGVVIEVFGMDADFYFKKKIPKIKNFIETHKEQKIIIFTPFFNLPKSMKPILSHVVTEKELLLKRLIDPQGAGYGSS